MTHPEPPRWLEQAVDDAVDHILGPPRAEITLVEYGSYACPYCRAANEEIARVRDCFGDRLRYVFRHLPIAGSDLAIRAAELAERADRVGRFWQVHVTLMTRSARLTEEDLVAVADDLGLASVDHQAAAAKPSARRLASRLMRRGALSRYLGFDYGRVDGPA